MKKILSFVIALVLTLSTFLPASGQKGRSIQPKLVQPHTELTQFGVSEAVTDGRGVLVRWTMQSETDNVGFEVYRVADSRVERVTTSMILGSKRGFGSDTAFGERYSFFDPSGSLGSVYILEANNSNGSKVRSQAFGTTFDTDLALVGVSNMETVRDSSIKNNPMLERRQLDLPTELNTEVVKSTVNPDLAAHRAMVAQAGVKLGIKVDGFYRVSRAELQAAGFDVNSDPVNWQIFCDGVEQPIVVGSNGDYLEFLGKARETIESDARYYFLVAGTSAGKRIPTRSARAYGGTTSTQNYRQSYFKKERVNYIYTILNGDAENYWGNVISTSTSNFAFNLSGIDVSSPTSTVEIKFQGFTNVPHTVNLAINGQAISPATGTGITPFSIVLTVPTNILIEGANTLAMTSIASGDFSLFDSIRVDYLRKYAADQNQIAFYTTNYRGAKLTGFSSANIRVFDTTIDGAPIQLVNVPVVQNGPTFDANLPAARGRMMYAVEDSAIKPVPSIRPNYGSTLATAGHAGKLVIITHRDFLTQANAWAAYRTQPGFPVEVVDVDDIFDEFNFGQPSANSITAFLSYAVSNWATPPQYTLLLGDASFDPKNYNGFGYLNLVPTKLINTVYEETGSDEAMTDFNGDGLSELSVGRIPALTAQVAGNSLAMVQAFETPAMQNLNRGAIFAYDLPVGFDFQAMSVALAAELTAANPKVMVDRGAANSQATLIGEINNGRYIVNYSGHGATGTWAHSSFFTVNNVPSLTNANNRSIFTMLTCLNGYFTNPFSDSLAEALLKAPNGGAVASWASTGKTTPDIQSIMGLRFYNQLNAGNITRLGDLIRDAKAAIPGGSDVRLSWALLGDPMLKVR